MRIAFHILSVGGDVRIQFFNAQDIANGGTSRDGILGDWEQNNGESYSQTGWESTYIGLPAQRLMEQLVELMNQQSVDDASEVSALILCRDIIMAGGTQIAWDGKRYRNVRTAKAGESEWRLESVRIGEPMHVTATTEEAAKKAAHRAILDCMIADPENAAEYSAFFVNGSQLTLISDGALPPYIDMAELAAGEVERKVAEQPILVKMTPRGRKPKIDTTA